MSIKLSICIPTKNYGAFIGQALQSIIEQAVDGLEIVIVDGGSLDNTQEVVKYYERKFPELRYVRQERAMGVDKDLATAVGLARGDYCWPMSADDILKPGALRRVMQEISLGLDTYLCNRTHFDCDNRLIGDSNFLEKKTGDRVFNFNDREEIIQYFNLSRSVGALFSYISSIIFSRRQWDQVKLDDRLIGTNYMHVYTLFTMLKAGGNHKYIQQPLIFCRLYNDSFLAAGDEGIVKRYLIDIDGYHLLGELLFPDKTVWKAFMRVMQYEHRWFKLIRLAIRMQDDLQWKNIELKLLDFGYKPSQIFLIDKIRRIERFLPFIRFLRQIRHKLAFYRMSWKGY